jgi:alpha-galactosidase
MLDLSMAGLNHLSFVLDLWDHDTGEDLYATLKEQIAKGRTASQPATAHLMLESGYFAAAGDDHLRAFLPPTPQSIPRRAAEEEHGDAERKRWLKMLLPIAEGKKPYAPLLATRTWERPIELIAALRFNRPASAFPCLNLVNARQLPQLPHEVFVETGATVDRTGIYPAEYTLPESLLPLLRQTARVTDTLVRAARWSSLELLREVVELDPTITDKAAGWRAVEECLRAHADVLATYS